MMLKAIPKEYHDSAKGTLKLLWEDEWRAMGMTQVSLDFSPSIADPPLSERRGRRRRATSLTRDFSSWF